MNKDKWPNLNAGIEWQAGVLVDRDIRVAMENQQLVLDGDPERAKYAAYELAIGNRIEELVLDDDREGQRDLYRSKAVPEDGVFQVLPGHTFKIYAKETLYMPSDVTAIAIPVGIMYKLGVHPETTFADPGFAGPFFVTICNYSPRVVKLRVGEPLARLFFLKLCERPEKIHEGTPRDVPPDVERVPRPTDEDLREGTEGSVLQRVLELVDPPHYEHAFITNRIVGVHRAHIEESINGLKGQLKALRWVVFGLGTIICCVAIIALWRLIAGASPTFASGVIASVTASLLLAGAVWGGRKALTWVNREPGVQR